MSESDLQTGLQTLLNTCSKFIHKLYLIISVDIQGIDIRIISWLSDQDVCCVFVDIIHSPFLATFPMIADQHDLMKLLRVSCLLCILSLHWHVCTLYVNYLSTMSTNISGSSWTCYCSICCWYVMTPIHSKWILFLKMSSSICFLFVSNRICPILAISQRFWFFLRHFGLKSSISVKVIIIIKYWIIEMCYVCYSVEIIENISLFKLWKIFHYLNW